MSELKVLIVDDSLTIRAMLEELIERYADVDIVGTAGSAQAAMEMINRRLPDIVLLDLRMPGMDGFGLLDAIHDHWHQMHVIVVSSAATKDSWDCHEAFLHGADACFDKARIVKNARELAVLIGEIGAEKISRAAHEGDAVTLPDPAEFEHALPQMQTLAETMIPVTEAAQEPFSA